jgi:Uma2 family endonuclease
MPMPRRTLPFENLGEMMEQLGSIDPRRIRSWPPPGQATEKDVLRILDSENRLYELVDGVLVEKVMSLKASLVAGDILTAFNNFVKPKNLGIVPGSDGALKLMPRLIRIPDVSFISWAQLPALEYPDDPIPHLHPDIAVEVLSEGNTKEEMRRKVREYFFSGASLVWLVDPDMRTARVYTSPDESTALTEADALDGGDVLPGFSLPLKELFARVPRTAPRRPGRGKGNATKKRRA